MPFGDVRLHDKRDNGGNHAIHNHFILKSLRATRPGGLVTVITSAYTMDAANPAARREMQQMADLVGAVRLPSRAHARAAGTDALTDVLIFRRREDDRDAAPFDWEYTAPLDVAGSTVRVNAYFVDHPQRVLGRFAVGDGLYRHDELSVAGDPATAPAALREALSQIADEARDADLTMSAATGEPVAVRPAARLASTHTQPDGYLRANPDGTFSRRDDGAFEDYAPPKTQAAELRALLGLRDTAVALLEAEASSLDDTADIDRLRAELNTRYDAYAAAHGPINRFTDVPARRKDKQTGKMVPALDEETGEPLMRRQRPPQGGFRHDPFSPVVRALERFDEETQVAGKADIFTERVVAPRPPRLGADTPADALAICIDDHGQVRLPTIAWLLGVDEEEARQQLGTLVYDDPQTGRLEPAAAYLSGDVKTKLGIARAAADDDDRYAVNVAALEKVVPRDLGPDEIVIKMGAPWIGAAHVQQFLAEILDDPSVVVEHGGGAMWTVHSDHNHTVAATSTWGTSRRNAAEIAQHILEQREFMIKDTVGRNPRREVVNLDAIMAATEKAVEMRERFADWVWEDAERAAALVATYNDTFQRYVPRSYDDAQLSLPGLAMVFKPDPHQVAAAARIINEPAVGLYHAVGAGKTASMIMGVMELRRLGLARKPVVVVPNQLLDQWTREFLRLYPQAKLLAASTEDLDKDRRRLMVARMATGDWDAVILTESAFEMLPMTPDAEQAYVDAQMAELDERIGAARAAGAELTLKRLETKKANRESRLEERLDTDKDAGIWWELTGIDYIFRDESHRDKNLRTVSNVSGMSIKGSQRAQQMDMKLAWLRERQPRWGTRATGTPIANSIVELFTEFRYLRPDLMEQQGITDVDSWLATYAEGKVVIEVTPDGGGLRNKTRLEFVNLDELITAMHVFADVKTKDDLNLERPALAERADGQRLPEMVVVQPSAQLLDKVAELVDRAARLKGRRPEKGGDNILKIGGEGAAAALDLRLVDLSTDEPQKLDVAADRIAGYYHANADRIYLGPDGEPHPVPGSLQMAFCDLGTPSTKDPDRWTSYGELRSKLVARGVPREKIRFIHEATDDRQRAELFAACRDGRVAVLIASTEKGGTGVNVQDRLLALHELDCPWRPCDLEQREGRIDRRGNQNDEIRIERYVTERSLDAFRWQKVAYKARQADLVMTGKAGRRSEDVGDVTISYEEMKAAATGNPLLVDHAKAKADVTRLERLERGYHRNQAQLRWTIRGSRQEIDISRALIADVDAAIGRRTNTRGDAFTMTVRGRTYTTRAEANERLKGALGLVLADPANRTGPAVPVGEFGGFTITAQPEAMLAGNSRSRAFVHGLQVALAAAPGTELRLHPDDLKTADLVTRLDNRLAKLETVRDNAAREITHREAEIARADQDLAKPFRHAHDLADAKDRFQHLDIQVVALAAAANAETGVGEPDDGPAEPVDNDARPAPTRDALQTPTPIHGDRPATRRPAPSSPPAASPGVPEVLARAALPEADHRWLTTQLEQLVADPRMQQVARANDYDHARLVIDERIPELFADAFDSTDIDGQDLTRRFFDNTDGWFREAFTTAASHAIYEQARAALPAPVPAPAATESTGKPAADAPPASGHGTAEPTPSTADGALPETQRRRRGHAFYPPAKVAAPVPALYATEQQPAAEKTLYLHYFGGSYDCWLAEYDPSTGEGFGYVSLGDPDNAEWGYVSLPELEQVNAGLVIIERDLYWTPTPAGEANLPGWRAPRPQPRPAVESTTPDPDQAPAPDPIAVPTPDSAVPALVPAEPRVHHFDSSGEAYDASQSRDDIRDGDVLTVPSERVVAVLNNAWPVAVTDNHGAFHRLAGAEAAETFAAQYPRSVAIADQLRREMDTGPDQQEAPDPDDELTPEQHAAVDELGKEPGQPWSIRREWRLRTFATLTAEDLAALPGDTRQALTDEVQQLLESPALQDRATARRLLQRWSGTSRALTDAQQAALDALCHPSNGHGTPDAGRLGRYGRLTAAEFLTLDAPDREDIKADLKAIAASGATKTIARNRTSLGTTIRGVPADHVIGADNLLRRLGPDLAVAPYRSNADSVGRTVVGLRLNPGDQIAHRGGTGTVDRVGLNLNVYLVGGDTLPDSTRRYRLIAAGPDPAGAAQPGQQLPPGSPGADPEPAVSAPTPGDPRHRAAVGETDPPATPSPATPTPASLQQDGTTDPAGPEVALAPVAPPGRTPTEPIAVTEPGAAVGGTPPATPASWSSRIRVEDSAAGLTVTGTTGAPREDGLRGLLKQHRFRYRDGQWRFAGRPADRAAAVGDIHRWLAAQDRADAARASKPTMQLPPTAEQQRIIDAYLDGKTVAVQALAGTGKTSTLLMLAAARPERRIAYIAFNRSIADEAQRKFGRNVRADTSHAFAREALAGTSLAAKTAKAGPKSDGARFPEDWARVLDITPADVGEHVMEPETIARLVMGTVRAFRESADDTITGAHLPPGLPPTMAPLTPAIVSYATRAWQDITDPAGKLMFDHDDYLKVWALGNPRLPYDAIFFDEAQDINAVLRKVIQDQPAQTIVVGDSNQSIYGFRGALDALKDWPADVTLPLTQSWRFGPAVAEVGNQFLNVLGSRWLLTGNPALPSTVGGVDRPDAVLARTNAGAVAAVFDAFDDDRRVALVGGARTIEDIAKAAKDLQAGRRTKHPELSRFANWDEVRDYVENDEHAQSLRAFVRLVDRRGADGLLYMAKQLVDEKDTDPAGNPNYDVVVSTAHKAKGREWDQVRVAEDFPHPEENLDTKKVTLPDAEELRLAYVTITRAKRRLELGSLSWIDDLAPQPVTPPPPTRAATLPPVAVTGEAPPVEAATVAGAALTNTAAAPAPRAETAAQLARLDTAPGVPVGPTAGNGGRHSTYSSASAASGPRVGPSV